MDNSPKIYDCFLFFNELDLLEFRLEMLNDYVDYFVIIESNVTFSGKEKEFVLENNIKRFEKYKDKIIYKKISDTPKSFNNLFKNFSLNSYTVEDDRELFVLKDILQYIDGTTFWPRNEVQWGREIFQRESMLRAIRHCSDDDIILISDIDEFPNVENFNFSTVGDDFITFKQKMFYYYINMLFDENWVGTKVCKYKLLKTLKLNQLRMIKDNKNVVEDGGWHFSYLGGEQQIKEKIEAYSHQEFNNDNIKNGIKSNVGNCKDLFGRNIAIKTVELDNSFPKIILDNIEKYKNWIK